MRSDALTNPLVQSFRRKLQPALQLTQDDVRREVKQGGDAASILARLRPLVLANFKPVAQIAAQLIAAGFTWEVEEVHGTAGWVFSDPTGNHDLVNDRSDLGMRFVLEFQDMFTDLWCRLVLQAELEAPSQEQTQAQTVHGDARSRAMASESGAAEKESAEHRHRREAICEAARLGLTGQDYCKYLHQAGLRPSTRLKDCPKTYSAAYKLEKFRKSIQQEKSRIVAESRRSALKSSKKLTVQ